MKNRFSLTNPPNSAPGMRNLINGLITCGSVEEFRALSPLPRDAQRIIDNAVIEVGLERLVIMADFLEAGLTYSLPNWLAVPEVYWEAVGKTGHAQRSMVPKARGERQVAQREGFTIPIYCTWDDFSFGIRELLASQRVGAPLDTSHTSQAARRVNEAFEDSWLYGPGFNVRGNTAYGLLNHPDIPIHEFIDNESWTAAGHSGEDIINDIKAMVQVAQSNFFPGPYNLYIPSSYGHRLNDDYKAATTDTIASRIGSLTYGGRPIRIREADQLPDDTVILIQMTSDVADVIVGQEPTPISWSDGPGFETYFIVLGCMIPRIKINIEGGMGIVIGQPGTP